MTVSAGLHTGKEGPIVHIAAGCGDLAARFATKYQVNLVKRRELLAAAAAAGVAVAFGAPLGCMFFEKETMKER
jgi:chloride channel 3/4/5